MGFASIEEAIKDIKNGKMIVVVDDEDREYMHLTMKKMLKTISQCIKKDFLILV